MHCTNSKEMTFRVFEFKAYLLGVQPMDVVEAVDTGKEFTITEKDVAELHVMPGSYSSNRIDEYNIATAMLKKIYGFEARIHGWRVDRWKIPFNEGSINGIWKVKRVL